jgi:hypothetical protein
MELMNTLEERLDLFLSGRLAREERAGFIHEVKKNRALMRLLESETGFEAQAYSLAWWTKEMSGCFQDMAHKEIFSRQEWEQLIKTCLDRSVANPEQVPADKKILRFPRPLRYLAAACFIGVIAASIFLAQQMVSRPSSGRMVSIGQIHNALETPDSTDRSSPPVTFDSLIIYGSARARPIASGTDEGIVRFGNATAVLVEKNTTVKVTGQSDSVVSMTLSQGSALFSVEKKRFREFTIQTPLSTITVTGTVFRVSVDDYSTMVSVLEGSVLTKGQNDSTSTAVLGGMSARITAAGVTLIPGDTAATLPYRPNLLRDFLMENGVWENGAFVRTGIRSDATALNKQFLAIRRTILGRAPESDSLTLAFAHSYPNSSMTGEVLLDLGAMHLGRGDTASCLAILDSTLAFGDNDHAAEAFHRMVLLCLDSQKDPAPARHIILRYLSRFPYDPRSFELLGRLTDMLWKRQEHTESQALLLQATELTAPNIHLEVILFRHAERLQSIARDFTRSLDWYLYIADHYPGGAFHTRALDSAAQCVVQSGLHRHENYSHRINDFLHPDGLKR